MPVSKRPRVKKPSPGPWPTPKWREPLIDWAIITLSLVAILLGVARWLP